MTKNTDEMGKKAITISFDMFEQWESLTDEEAGRLVKEIGSYVCYGTITTTPATKAMFATYKKQVDEERQKYEAQCERNKANRSKGATSGYQSLPVVTKEEKDEENEKERSKEKDKEEDKEEEKKTLCVKEKSEKMFCSSLITHCRLCRHR